MLSSRVAYLILEDVGGIMLLTFTNKAAVEITIKNSIKKIITLFVKKCKNDIIKLLMGEAT
ncbi:MULTISPECIES: hypothetical protein [Clostridium]|uniref:hypothetical protein n=1 Tax=Clostridium TaxID=1485 RepID=UPI000824334C|nr:MULTISPECIES: hypothetical protein [Clostridium]PJI10091.1 hypothetical protein CUB90_20435 [Clostridium sp. CT7]